MRHARSVLIAAMTLVLFAGTLFCSAAVAAPLGTMVLEGQLRTVAGSAVPDGDYTLKVSLYAGKQDLKSLHSELIATKVTGGGFTVAIGLAAALKPEMFADGSAAWVGIQVGTEAELPRLPLNHVAYAFAANTAGSAGKLTCTGCVKAEQLDNSVLADYAKTETLKAYVGVDQACDAGQVATGFAKDGKIVCAKDANDTYSGKQFALASQSCPTGQVVAKIDADGKVQCELGGKTYDGKDFAVADQKCPPDQVVVAVGADGKFTCAVDQKGDVSGKDFALSDQDCGKGKVVRTIDAAGKVVCADIAYEKPVPAGAFTAQEVANLSAGKLADGKTPWEWTKTYDITTKWLRTLAADKNFLAYGRDRQMVFRTDGDTQYATGVGNYPWAFMYGGDTDKHRAALIQKDGTMWTKSYGWLHQRFAAANKSCKAGETVVGIDAAGAITCAADANTTYGAGTFMQAEKGNHIGAKLSDFDARYVNEGQANSITGAMLKDGTINGADLAASSITSGHIKDGEVKSADIAANQIGGGHVADSSLTGSDIKDASLSGADLAANSITSGHIKDGEVKSADIAANQIGGSHVADGSLSGADIADESLTGSDIKNESLTGTDIQNGSITGSDLANETVTSADIKNDSVASEDIKNESLTGTDIKNGSLTYADTNVDSIQRRVTGTCPVGQSIAAVKNDGSVTCVSVDDVAKTAGTCKAGAWHRIAQVNNGTGQPGDRFDGVVTVRDYISSGGHSSATFRVSGGFGDRNGLSFTLLNHGRYNVTTFTLARLLTKSTYDVVYLDVYCARSGAVDFTITNNQHGSGLKAIKWGAASVPTGYATSQYDLDKLIAAGNTGDRWSVDRSGNTWNAGVGRSDGGFQVDGKVVVDGDAGWHRAHGKTGFYMESYGGGIYMLDSTWVRVYGNKSLLVNGALRVEDGSGQVDLGAGASPNVELRSKKSGTPFIDFSNDAAVDYDARIRLVGDDALVFEGTQVGIGRTPTYNIDVAGTGRIDQMGIGTTVRSGYSLDMGGPVDMSNNHIHYINQAHFNGGARFESQDTHYVRFRWDSGSNGGIHFQDGNSKTQGYVYGDGGDTDADFGLLDAEGSWAVRVATDSYTALLVNGAEKIRAHSSGATVTGTLTTTALTIGSKSLSDYIKDTVNSRCYIYFGHVDSCESSSCKTLYAGGYIRGDGTCYSGYGGNSTQRGRTTCQDISWSSSYTGSSNKQKALGLNLWGGVGGDDKIWIRLICK